MGKVMKYLEENGKKEEVPTFKKNVNGVFKGLLGKFKDLQFFTGRKIFWILKSRNEIYKHVQKVE